MAENSDSDCESDSDNEEEEELQFIITFLLSGLCLTHTDLILL